MKTQFGYVNFTNSYVTNKGATYPVVKLLGSGSFGSVYKSTEKRVIKEIEGGPPEGFEQEVLVQIKTYEAVPGSCPKIFDFGKKGLDNYVIVMEEFDNTARYIIGQNPDLIPDYLRQVAQILHKLEPFEFNHRDLKSDNVMYTMEDNKIRFALIDFGFACITVDGKKYAGLSYFPPESKCFRNSRDLAQMIYELEKYTPDIPDEIRTFLRLLLTFDIKGKKCEMFKGCPPHMIDTWADTYDFLDNDAIENPHTTPEGLLHALDVFETHGLEACQNGFVVDPVKNNCVPKPSDEVVAPTDKPVSPKAHALNLSLIHI